MNESILCLIFKPNSLTNKIHYTLPQLSLENGNYALPIPCVARHTHAHISTSRSIMKLVLLSSITNSTCTKRKYHHIQKVPLSSSQHPRQQQITTISHPQSGRTIIFISFWSMCAHTQRNTVCDTVNCTLCVLWMLSAKKNERRLIYNQHINNNDNTDNTSSSNSNSIGIGSNNRSTNSPPTKTTHARKQ